MGHDVLQTSLVNFNSSLLVKKRMAFIQLAQWGL